MLYLLILVFSAIPTLKALQVQGTEDGSCIPFLKPAPNIDVNFPSQFNYLSAGSRYHLYRTAASHPRFRQMREHELRTKMCTKVDGSSGLIDIIGFGETVLARYNMTSRPEQPAVIDAVLVNRRGEQNVLVTKTITLTDYTTFAFVVSCWHDTNVKSWDVISVNTNLSATPKRAIERHALSLGFNPENNIFLDYSSCGIES